MASFTQPNDTAYQPVQRLARLKIAIGGIPSNREEWCLQLTLRATSRAVISFPGRGATGVPHHPLLKFRVRSISAGLTRLSAARVLPKDLRPATRITVVNLPAIFRRQNNPNFLPGLVHRYAVLR